MREEPAEVERKIRRMPTDPAARAPHRSGRPGACPVWQFHQVYSDAETQAWVVHGCTTAGIGCLDCKQPVIDAILREQAPGASAPSRTGQPEAGALDRRGRHRARAHGGPRDDARRARGDGPQLLRRAAQGRRPRLHGRAARRGFGAVFAGPALRPIRLSVPASRRVMLARWRQIRSAAITSSASRDRVGALGEHAPERREHGSDERGERRVAEETRR